MPGAHVVDLSVPLFKQGDDVMGHLEEANGSVLEALRRYQDQLEGAAAYVRAVLDHLKDVPEADLELDGGAHVILLSAPDEIAKELVNEGLAHRLNDTHDDDADAA